MPIFKIIDYLVDDAGTRVHFQRMDPGPNEETDVYVSCTDAELPTTLNQTQTKTVLVGKLNRKYVAGVPVLNTAVAGGMSITI